jgi:hypothetical protein
VLTVTGGQDVFVHAEEFKNRDEARARYLQITGRLRAERDRDLGCYNLLYAGRRPVVAIIAPEAPPADVLAGWRGKPIELPCEFWEMLALRHGRSRAHEQHEQQHGGTWSAPDGREILEKPPDNPRLEEWEEWGVRRRDAHARE